MLMLSSEDWLAHYRRRNDRLAKRTVFAQNDDDDEAEAKDEKAAREE
jgi:hypothetical protein